jgi:hypothetical protein
MSYGTPVGLQWKKSEASGSENCVEVAFGDDAVFVRNSRAAANGLALAFTTNEWKAFLVGARAGEFEVPNMGT